MTRRIMRGKLYLSGGGDENQTYNADKQIFADVKKILYIPLAWEGDKSYALCKKWFENMISKHKPISYDMIITGTTDRNLNNYDLIYIGGGNTFKLLKELRASDLSKKIIDFLNNGGSVYGGSAGAIIWGKHIDQKYRKKIISSSTDADKNKVKQSNTSGFNLVKGYDIQCHFIDEELNEYIEYSKNKSVKILAIPEESVLEFDGKNFRVFGTKKVTIIDKKNISKI